MPLPPVSAATLRRCRPFGLIALAMALAVALAWLEPIPPAASAVDDQVVVVNLVGDVGLNSSNVGVDPRGGFKHGFETWSDMMSGIAADIHGDVNFMNLETVVTDRNNLAADTKGQSGPFNFRSHPDGVRHLVSRGFNLISLANNHSMDYGVPGLTDTLRHIAALRPLGVLGAAGIGMNREEASRPQVFKVKASTIGFSATGIVTNNLERHRAGPDRPGQIAYRFDDDYKEVRSRLVAAPAALRILSIHYGVEGHVRADDRQKAEWRGEAALRDGIDLIVGHHAHVVRGVELAGHSLIFYGLGNFLHLGTANMTSAGICRDYGLLARVYLRKTAGGHLELRAVEAIPVTDTHFRPRRLAGAQGVARVHVLNYLASLLDGPADGARGLRFTPQADGTGLYCQPGAERDPGRIGTLCRGFSAAPPIPEALRSQIAGSCSS